jgi:BirA family biotin operon repressor/biotin-[acetyl-CoA-carboxylase] ligase
VPAAVCEAAEALAPVRCQIKWPNDVWVEGRKLAGILLEGRPEAAGGGWAVIGVGLNVAVPAEAFPEELRKTATSLDPATSVARALQELNASLAAWIDRDRAEVLAAFRERDALRGRRISWQGGSGVAGGIDDAGHLLVDQDGGGQVSLGAGEVHLSVS